MTAEHKPNEEMRAAVFTMASVGTTAEAIATAMGITRPTLLKHYRDEIDAGTDAANSAVSRSLWSKATGDGPQAVTAAIWWSKTRMGWKETQVVESRDITMQWIFEEDTRKNKSITIDPVKILQERRAREQEQTIEGELAQDGD